MGTENRLFILIVVNVFFMQHKYV